jgi:hypothetical protein
MMKLIRKGIAVNPGAPIELLRGGGGTKYYHFDGTPDRGEILDPFPIAPQSDGKVAAYSARIKLTSSPSIVHFVLLNANSIMRIAVAANGAPQMQYRDGLNATRFIQGIAGTVVVGTEHTLAAVFNGINGQVQLQLDGSAVGTHTDGWDVTDMQPLRWIGSNTTGTDNQFVGAIYDLNFEPDIVAPGSTQARIWPGTDGGEYWHETIQDTDLRRIQLLDYRPEGWK